MEIDKSKLKQPLYCKAELYLFQKYGFTLKSFTDEILRYLLEHWGVTVDNIVKNVADEGVSDELLENVRINLMDLILANGQVAYIMEKWTVCF